MKMLLLHLSGSSSHIYLTLFRAVYLHHHLLLRDDLGVRASDDCFILGDVAYGLAVPSVVHLFLGAEGAVGYVLAFLGGCNSIRVCTVGCAEDLVGSSHVRVGVGRRLAALQVADSLGQRDSNTTARLATFLLTILDVGS